MNNTVKKWKQYLCNIIFVNSYLSCGGGERRRRAAAACGGGVRRRRAAVCGGVRRRRAAAACGGGVRQQWYPPKCSFFSVFSIVLSIFHHVYCCLIGVLYLPLLYIHGFSFLLYVFMAITFFFSFLVLYFWLQAIICSLFFSLFRYYSYIFHYFPSMCHCLRIVFLY